MYIIHPWQVIKGFRSSGEDGRYVKWNIYLLYILLTSFIRSRIVDRSATGPLVLVVAKKTMPHKKKRVEARLLRRMQAKI